MLAKARISGDRFDYTSERQRREKFDEREALLTRLDELLVEGGVDRRVVADRTASLLHSWVNPMTWRRGRM